MLYFKPMCCHCIHKRAIKGRIMDIICSNHIVHLKCIQTANQSAHMILIVMG